MKVEQKAETFNSYIGENYHTGESNNGRLLLLSGVSVR